MAISLALTAAKEGATQINYAEVKSFIKEGELIKALIKPVFGSKATNAPLLFLKNFLLHLIQINQY